MHGQVAPSTQNQALAAILFLYRHVLEINLPWLEGVTRAARPRHIPVVLTREETRRVLAELQGTPWLVSNLLYGSGLRLQEALMLRVKDLDLERLELVVRDGKGRKDRVTTLPASLRLVLEAHLAGLREWFSNERAAGHANMSRCSRLMSCSFLSTSGRPSVYWFSSGPKSCAPCGIRSTRTP